MGDARFTPQKVEPTADAARLAVVWEDGVTHEYEPRFLRLHCPCAGCVDEMTGVRTLDPARISVDVHPLEIHYVGRYALQFVWSDGHSTGLYPFEFLRRLAESQADESTSGE